MVLRNLLNIDTKAKSNDIPSSVDKAQMEMQIMKGKVTRMGVRIKTFYILWRCDYILEHCGQSMSWGDTLGCF